MGRKYIHGFIKGRLIEEGISHDQSLVIRHILDFMNSNKMTKLIHEGEVYYWIKYDKIVSDLDILGIKKQALSDMMIYDLCEKPNDWEQRLESMAESTKKKRMKAKFIGIFKRYTKKDNDGTYSYFAPTDKLYSLQEDITDNDYNMLKKENKKVPTVGAVEDLKVKLNSSNNSICDTKDFNTSSEENIQENINNKPMNLVKEARINIKKTDMNEVNEKCTNIDALKIAINSIKGKSHGINALMSAYNEALSGNSKSSGYKVKETSLHYGVNKTFDKYTPEELEKKLQEIQNRKFGNVR